ncbi:MAG: hypothetical protein A4E45_02036 [Methanosaeta sp. PtaB.Bin039]|nr:MAG: hypothetical protein A4E45_02036 [Methanosaeta sp. PtaB.Bin039]
MRIPFIPMVVAVLALLGSTSAMTNEQYESSGLGSIPWNQIFEGMPSDALPPQERDYGSVLPSLTSPQSNSANPTYDFQGSSFQQTVVDPLYPDYYPVDTPTEYYEPMEGQAAFFTNQEPRDFGRLVDTGEVTDFQYIMSDVPAENGLWIADGAGSQRLTTLNVPSSSWANQEIIPSTEGEMVIYYQYPSGEIRSHNMGYVYPYHRYWTWFYGPTPGAYKVWYVIGGVYYSNYIWYYVWDDWPWWRGGYTFNRYYYDPLAYTPNLYYYYPAIYTPIKYYYSSVTYPVYYSSIKTSTSYGFSSRWSGYSASSSFSHKIGHKR